MGTKKTLASPVSNGVLYYKTGYTYHVYHVKGFLVTESISLQIKALRKLLDLSQEQLARRIEVTKKTVAEWEQGRQPPSPERLLQLAKLAPPGTLRHALTRQALGLIGAESNLVLEALLDGRIGGAGPLPGGDLRVVAPADWAERLRALEGLDHYSPVPLLRDAAAAGAARAITESDIEGYVLVPYSWCPDSENFSCLRVRGDSMAPILNDGAIVGIDLSQRDPAMLHQQMVAARHEEGVTIKWLERQPDGNLLLVPENKSQPTLRLPRAAMSPIIGAVAWYWNRPRP